MSPAVAGLDALSPPSSLFSPSQNALAGFAKPLPAPVEAALWRGDQLGGPTFETLASGFPVLDASLPGCGWPCGALTEVLVPQFSVAELRLLSKVLAALTSAGRTVAMIGPPMTPHAPGLRHDGIDERHLIWVDVDTPRDRLWATEQLVKSGSFGATVAWLPLVRSEQIRRLQVLAARCTGPVFLCRPDVAARDASAAPLRVLVRAHTDWQIAVQVLKRKGTPLDETLLLPSMPGGLNKIMTPRLRYPSRLIPVEPSHAVVSPAAAAVRKRSDQATVAQP
jgi:protein ImuA